MEQYDAKTIEERWQRVWDDARAFHVSNEERRPKSYVLEMLPYPSGTLHMGHMLVYTIGDVVTRFRARNGMQVLHPQGFDRRERGPKSYVLELLPYPSGTLHMGHMLVYTIGDVVTRFRAATACTCSTRRDSTRSACPPRTPRSRRASTHA